MAHAATTTIKKIAAGEYVIDISETDVAAGSTVTIQPGSDARFPQAGRIFRVSSVKDSGDATTLAPVLSGDSDFAGPAVVASVTAAASPIDEQFSGGLQYASLSGALYHRSTPDAGTNNVVRTRYLIKDGWE